MRRRRGSSGGRPRRTTRLNSVLAWSCYLFLLMPSLVVVPVSLGSSSEFEFPPRHLSLALYRLMFSDRGWWGSILESLTVAGLATALALAVAVPAAYALQRASFPGKRMLAGIALSPMLVPVVVIGLGLYLEFAPLGLINTTSGLVLAHAMLVAPFVLVSVTSGLRHVDPALETAALIMGASRARIFFEILLPQLRAAIAVAALFTFLISFDEVVIAYFISGPQTTTLPVKMYSAIRWEISPVIAAVSTLLTAVSLAFAFGIMMLQEKDTPA